MNIKILLNFVCDTLCNSCTICKIVVLFVSLVEGFEHYEVHPNQVWLLKSYLGKIGDICVVKLILSLEVCFLIWKWVTYSAYFGIHINLERKISITMSIIGGWEPLLLIFESFCEDLLLWPDSFLAWKWELLFKISNHSIDVMLDAEHSILCLISGFLLWYFVVYAHPYALILFILLSGWYSVNQ